MRAPSSVVRAVGDAFQWRLLLLWMLALALPTVLVAWPLGQALGGTIDHALDAADLARQFDLISMLEASSGWRADGYSPGSGATSALIVTLLLSPWLSGLAITAAEADPSRPPGFAALMRGGCGYYARLGRMLLWSFVPLGLVAGIGGLLRFIVDKRAEHAILESDVDLWRALAWGVTAVLAIVVHAGIESGRARFASEPLQRSALRAWWRGTRSVWRMPIATLGRYVVITAIGLAAAALLGIVRLQLPPIGAFGFLLAGLTTQLIVGAIAWTRCARLFALLGAERGVQRGERREDRRDRD